MFIITNQLSINMMINDQDYIYESRAHRGGVEFFSSILVLIQEFHAAHNSDLNTSLRRASRPDEGRRAAGLLGPGSGHPVLLRVPEGLLPTSLHPPLSRLRPGRVRRLLPRAPRRALPRLGPPGEGLQRLQPEIWGALAGQSGSLLKPL